MAAAAICVEDEAACAAAECAGIGNLDLAAAGAGAGGKRSVYLMDCAPVWGCASTRGRSTEMEDACAAAPRFADVPVRLLASRRDLDRLGLDADTLRLPAHLFGVFDGHGGAEVASYCRERLQVLLRQELRLLSKDLGETSEADMKEHWDELFTRCFQRLDDEVSGQASRLVGGVQETRPVAAENVGSTAVVAVVCSSHVVVANCGDSRVVLCRGKEPLELSIDHKVSFFVAKLEL
uniref:protein-serine/threonine phosphatase n=1 Tax=Zea mays TaxID=4577 RepID=A0A804QT42_MAIZE